MMTTKAYRFQGNAKAEVQIKIAANTIGEMVEVDLDTISVPNCPKCDGPTTLVPVGVCANPLKPYFCPTWTFLFPKCDDCGHIHDTWEERLFPEIEDFGSLTVMEAKDGDENFSSFFTVTKDEDTETE